MVRSSAILGEYTAKSHYYEPALKFKVERLQLALFKMFEGLPWTTLLSCIRYDVDDHFLRHFVELRLSDY